MVCYIEGKSYPRATCHVHHKNPRHAGGTDAPDNLIWLCANAHQLVHRVAQLIKANRKGQALDVAMSAYPAPAQRQRFMAIVGTEVLASSIAEDTGQGTSDVIIEVPIPKAEYAKLKMLVADYRTGGKKVSIAGYVSSIVLAHLHKRVP